MDKAELECFGEPHSGLETLLEEGAKLRGQRGRGELVFTLLLRTDDFPAQLPPPGLVGVEEALTEMQGVKHPTLQLHPALLTLLDTLQLAPTDPQQLQHLWDEPGSFVCLDVFQVPARWG